MSTEAPKAPRTKNPSYDVYREGDGGLILVMSDVKAPNRRTFVIAKHGDLQTITRSRKVEPQDVWS